MGVKDLLFNRGNGAEGDAEKLIKARVEPMDACEEIGGTLVEEDGKQFCYIRRLKDPDNPEVKIDPIKVLEKKRRPSRPSIE